MLGLFESVITNNNLMNLHLWICPSALYMWFNSLVLCKAIWGHRTWRTLVQVMPCCLMAPSHCLDQYQLFIDKVLWYSPEGNFTGNVYELNLLNVCQLPAYLSEANTISISKLSQRYRITPMILINLQEFLSVIGLLICVSVFHTRHIIGFFYRIAQPRWTPSDKWW